MTDRIKIAVQAMRAKHLELRGKLVADLDRSSGYPGAGELIADDLLAHAEKKFRKQFGSDS